MNTHHMVIRESEVKIPIPQTNLHIYGKLYGPLTRPLIIFVHGLTGYMDEYIFYAAARYFAAHGFSSFRFNLYDWHDDARNLLDCTLETHAYDFDIVVDYLRAESVTKIFAIGHSYGGPTILLSKKKDYNGLILWDACHYLPFTEGTYIKEIDAYHLPWGVDVLLSRNMYEEPKHITWDALMDAINVPVHIITAGKGMLVEHGQTYYEQAREPKTLTIIPEASHRFEEDGVPEKLYKASLDWLTKYVQA